MSDWMTPEERAHVQKYYPEWISDTIIRKADRRIRELEAAEKRATEAEARIKRHKELWNKAERKARELNDVVRADEDFIRALPDNLRLVQMATPTAYQFLFNCAAHEIEQLRARAQAVAEFLRIVKEADDEGGSVVGFGGVVLKAWKEYTAKLTALDGKE